MRSSRLERVRALLRRRRLSVLLTGLVLGGGALGWWWASLQRELVVRAPSHLVVDRRGQYLGEVPGEGGAFGYWPVPYVLPERMVKATLETEDRSFHQHGGVSPRAVARALWQNLKGRRVVSGASTLAMQVARMQSPGPRTLLRKAKEAVEALLLVRDHGHERVLRQYLTVAPYGNRVHGVVRGARLYFDKPVEDLSWLQAAYLAGLPQSPGRMDPYHRDGLKRGLRRAHRILRSLHARGVISEEELAQALRSDLGLVPPPRRTPEALHAVLAREGEALPLRYFASEPAGSSRRVLAREAAQMVRHILADPLARRPAFPAGGPLDFDYAVAVKTGTSQGFRDAWTVAFSDRLLVGVWVGNHDARRMNRLTGASAAARAVHQLMDGMMPLRSPHVSVLGAFPPPERHVGREVCTLSGKLAGPGCPGAAPWRRCPA